RAHPAVAVAPLVATDAGSSVVAHPGARLIGAGRPDLDTLRLTVAIPVAYHRRADALGLPGDEGPSSYGGNAALGPGTDGGLAGVGRRGTLGDHAAIVELVQADDVVTRGYSGSYGSEQSGGGGKLAEGAHRGLVEGPARVSGTKRGRIEQGTTTSHIRI